MSILVLGLGNTIMSDDGFGAKVVEMLSSRYRTFHEVCWHVGGTLGLDLLSRFEGIERLIIVDALDMRACPGTVFRLEREAVPRALAGRLSVHQLGIQDLLSVAEIQGVLPFELVVWGVQPERIEIGTELSEVVSSAVEPVIAGVVGEIRRWGINCH